jgi:hypothetical protein
MIQNSFSILFYLLTALACGLPAAAQTPVVYPTPSAQEKEVQAKVGNAEKEWLSALTHLRIGAVDHLESDQFTMLAGDHLASKVQQISLLRQRISDGGIPSNQLSLLYQNIRAFGETAVVVENVGITVGGQNPVFAPGLYWLTEVWHLEKGDWKIVHLHITSNPDRE